MFYATVTVACDMVGIFYVLFVYLHFYLFSSYHSYLKNEDSTEWIFTCTARQGSDIWGSPVLSNQEETMLTSLS